MLADRGCRVTVVPAQTPAQRRCWRCSPTASSCPTARAIRSPATTPSRRSARSLDTGMPIFGICLGHQLLGLASRRADRQDEVRPPRRQPPGAGPRHRPGDDHQPEPRLRGRRRRRLPANLRVDARVAVRRHRCRASRAPTGRRSASRATRRRARPARRRATCSTASSKLMDDRRMNRRVATGSRRAPFATMRHGGQARCRNAPTSRAS